MSQVYLSAVHKSSGKTTLSIALVAELVRRGLRVQPFKKGPDYIDPLWLSQAAGQSCLNLDFHTMSDDLIRSAFVSRLEDGDIGIIEGNVGLFDSVDLAGKGSNAAMAKLLGAPVVLVVDVSGMGRGVAPLLLGYQSFDPELNIAGVVLNKLGGGRHERNLRRVIAHFTDLPVFGAIPRMEALAIAERHLGLIPSNEAEAAHESIERIRELVCRHVDVDAIAGLAQAASAPVVPTGESPAPAAGAAVRIGIAKDEAFGFYYPDDLGSLERQGAELVPFSPISDQVVPEVDGLFIGGGFPEVLMAELESNASMRASIKAFVDAGGVTYAECGGLMYLCRSIDWQGQTRTMCGALSADVRMHARPQGRGYVRLRETGDFPWPGGEQGTEIAAHEFHHSSIEHPDPDWRYAYEVLRGTGIDGKHDGIVHKNLLASYSHLRDLGGVGWTSRFLARVRNPRLL